MMNNDLGNAKKLLSESGYTCVLLCGDTVHTSYERGVMPLLGFLKSGTDFSHFCAADKVVGRAVAFLYVLLGVKAVYAVVLSKGAKEVFERFKIDFDYDTLCESIINRAGIGMCPMEEATLLVTEPMAALSAIENKLLQIDKEKRYDS